MTVSAGPVVVGRAGWTVLLLTGAGVLLSGLPAAAVQPSPGGSVEARVATAPEATDEKAALGLLGAAVTAARVRSYTGTQYLASHRLSRASSGTARVRHVPGLGLDVTSDPTAYEGADDVARTVRTDVLDERSLELLAARYALSVSGREGCAGRSAKVVEVRRDGSAELAGRFWVDPDSHLVLRREVYDELGRVVRSSAFVDLDVTGPAVPMREVSTTPGEQVDVAALGDAWPVELPGGFELVDARRKDLDASGRDADVMHLAYSDGLSTLSVFAQDGRLEGTPGEGFWQEQVDGRPVWVRGTSPERVVWNGAGRTWTLLSDAPPAAVRAVVGSLPHEPVPDTGVLARVGRGAARVGSWINPFS